MKYNVKGVGAEKEIYPVRNIFAAVKSASPSVTFQ